MPEELSTLVQRAAAEIGDPDPGGFDRIAGRRRRRRRARRSLAGIGAVAALVGGVAVVQATGEDRGPASSNIAGAPEGEVPDVVVARCGANGVTLDTGAVRTREDGMHVRFINEAGGPSDFRVRVRSDFSSGFERVTDGVHDLVQPVPPGIVTVGCRPGIRGATSEATVELVDLAGHYTSPDPDCPQEDQVFASPSLDPPAQTAAEATIRGLEADLLAPEEVEPAVGYPAELDGILAADFPKQRVVRDGRTVAVVHPSRDGRLSPEVPEPPFGLIFVSACPGFLVHTPL